MFALSFLFLEALGVMPIPALLHYCHKGTYLLTPISGPEVCPSCRKGISFMSEDQHRNRECFNCTKVQDSEVEMPVKECNRFHDAEILCKPGFYRRRARNIREDDQCVKCSVCDKPTRICQVYHDTVCCRLPNYHAVLNKHGFYICEALPVFCARGQYLSTKYEVCLTCPVNTYMPEPHHTNTECKQCETNANNSLRIVQTCNSTHPNIFECPLGYFRHSSHQSPELLLTKEDCSPCRDKCLSGQIEGTLCDLDHDTVCCDSSNLTLCGKVEHREIVVGGMDSDKMTTSAKLKVCCVDENTDSSANSSTCQHCPEGTYCDNLNLTNSICKSCSEFKSYPLPVTCQAELLLPTTQLITIVYMLLFPVFYLL